MIVVDYDLHLVLWIILFKKVQNLSFYDLTRLSSICHEADLWEMLELNTLLFEVQDYYEGPKRNSVE